MSEEKINYEDYVLDPQNDVLVPMSTYMALTNIIQEVEKQHSKRIRTDKYAFFNKVSHKPLSAKGKAKMSKEKLEEEYYENIDMEATTETVRVDRDELGSAAIKMMSDFRGVFRHNVDQGRGIARPKQEANQTTGPALVTDEVKN